jgi:predicted O-linked N-acetylglucosamine transferase (SPINDLY family)
VALHQAGRLAEAERLYVQVRSIDPGNFTACYLQGVIQHGRGEVGPALASMERALAANSRAAAPLIYQGLLLEALGRGEEALASYNKAISAEPNLVEALVNRGSLLSRMGRDGHALADFDRALQLKPDFAPAQFNRGTALQNLGRHDEALAAFDRTLRLAPDHVDAMGNRATSLRALKRPAEALAGFDQVVKLQPRNVMAQYNRGVALLDLGRAEEALAAFDRALTLTPGLTIAHANRGAALRALGRHEEAFAAYKLAPGDFETMSDIGSLLHDMERYPQALVAYHAALKLKDDATIHNNRGGVLQNMRRMEDARAAYDAALALDPNHAEALNNRAYLNWQHFRDLPAALADREKLFSIDPDFEYGLGNLILLRLSGGDWRGFPALKLKAEEGVRAGKRVIRPYIFQAISSSPADLQACSRNYTAHSHPPLLPLWQPRRHQKVRLGYLCGEFRMQATSILAAGLFEAHDKSRFELIAIDNDKSDGSAMRARLETAFDGFMSIAGDSDDTAAARIADAEIDILINLNGYFGLPRMGVFARKPAPIQVNYLGFPATLGAPYMDYIIADRIVIPDGEQRFYDEQVVWLPDSYQVNDDKRPIGAETVRAAHGLPESAFVFCNFNQSYKLLPPMFDSWMRILAAVPESVLWLWDNNAAFVDHIRREAELRGVAGSRLIFAPTADHPDHLARLKLADLALDELPYNAHTTGSDALWAGLPLLTCRGTAFPGRVAASLLSAIGLPELVTENLGGFEAKAVALATNRDELTALRARLGENRTTMPLFDTARYCRNMEAAYQTMWEKFLAGEAPAGFTV